MKRSAVVGVIREFEGVSKKGLDEACVCTLYPLTICL